MIFGFITVWGLNVSFYLKTDGVQFQWYWDSSDLLFSRKFTVVLQKYCYILKIVCVHKQEVVKAALRSQPFLHQSRLIVEQTRSGEGGITFATISPSILFCYFCDSLKAFMYCQLAEITYNVIAYQRMIEQ